MHAAPCFCTEVVFSCADGGMAEREFDLFEICAPITAKLVQDRCTPGMAQKMSLNSSRSSDWGDRGQADHHWVNDVIKPFRINRLNKV
jgi:hypothetical protein